MKTFQLMAAGVMAVCSLAGASAAGAASPVNASDDTTKSYAPTEFAKKNQLYKIPCGSVGSNWIASVNIGSEFRYPLATVNNAVMEFPQADKPDNQYVLFSREAATVYPGENQMRITLNAEPDRGQTLMLYADWDRNGVFEFCELLPATAEVNTTLTVPADVLKGASRLRLRLNENGLDGADDDVCGQVLDLRIIVAPESSEFLEPTVKSNDENRGTVRYVDGHAIATANAGSTFLYWKDGFNAVSADADYAVPPSKRKRTLTAYFSPCNECGGN